MSNLLARLRRLLARRRGAFFVEYSSLVLLIAIAAVALFSRLGDRVPHGGLP
jgi:Flp pilus assembly pilin Flp